MVVMFRLPISARLACAPSLLSGLGICRACVFNEGLTQAVDGLHVRLMQRCGRLFTLRPATKRAEKCTRGLLGCSRAAARRICKG